MCDNPNIFVLPGWAHEQVVNTTGIVGLPGYQGVVMPGYYARTTGAV